MASVSPSSMAARWRSHRLWRIPARGQRKMVAARRMVVVPNDDPVGSALFVPADISSISGVSSQLMGTPSITSASC